MHNGIFIGDNILSVVQSLLYLLMNTNKIIILIMAKHVFETLSKVVRIDSRPAGHLTGVAVAAGAS